jgi:L-lactate dehydrogenase complex protein LldE
MTAATDPKPAEVLFFGTCLVDLLDPYAGLAAMRLIERSGIGVRFPQQQTCCGQPAWNAGFRQAARTVARVQLQVLGGDSPVVVPSASCAGMFRAHYPSLFADTPDAERAHRLAGRVVELCDFLDRVIESEPIDRGAPLRVALHQSCSARRETGTASAARRLLARFERLEVIEPEHAEECCGFGGTFAVKQPEIAAAMTADKVDAIVATGAPLLVSQDLGCLTNLDGTARYRGERVRAVHIATLVWERLQGAPVSAGPASIALRLPST